MPTTAREKGLPELTPGLAHRAAEVGREIAEAAREFAEAGHIMESVGAVEVGLGTAEAIPAVGAAAPYVAGFAVGAAVLTGLLALIGHAHDVGNNQAERRAFFHGFASHLVYGTVTGSLGSGHILGRRQIGESWRRSACWKVCQRMYAPSFWRAIAGGMSGGPVKAWIGPIMTSRQIRRALVECRGTSKSEVRQAGSFGQPPAA